MTNVIILILAFLGSIVVQGGTQDQEWKTSGMTATVVAKALLPVLKVEVQDVPDLDAVDPQASSCTVFVTRPYLREPALASPDNRLECVFKNSDGSAASLNGSLDQVKFEGWGNASSERYLDANGLPKPFQIYNDSEVILPIWTNLKAQSESNPAIRKSFYCGPGGVNCMETYYISNDPGNDLGLDCVVETENGQYYGSRCIFLYAKN